MGIFSREKTFEELLEEGLAKLTPQQQAEFALKCAFIAMPFLAVDGNFKYWQKEKRQKYLYSIFYLFDSTIVIYHYNKIGTARAASRDARDARDATRYAAIAATSATSAAIAAAIAAIDAAIAASRAAARAAARAATRAANTNIEPILLGYLAGAKHGGGELIDKMSFHWNIFTKALEKEGCGYWGNYYKEFIKGNFKVDENLLKTRVYDIPEEIKEKGAAAVADYLINLREGANRLNEARIIILGEKGAGKTCLARKLIDPNAEMTKEDESTAGVDTTLWKLEKEKINVNIWDFAGHTVTHAVHKFFLSERSLYIIVYDGRSEDRNRLKYWLDHMKNYGGDSKAIILVNERDGHKPDIPENFLKSKYPIERFESFSIGNNPEKLGEFRQFVIRYISTNPSWDNQKIPTKYFKVKEKLGELFVRGVESKGEEYISRDKFDEIAKDYEIEEPDKLLSNLHALGISLWYPDIEGYDTLVLNPEWISQGVYQVINWLKNVKIHSLVLDDFNEIFKENIDRYPVEQHEFIFNLMIHYELAYKAKNTNRLVIPHLLDEDQPAKEYFPEFKLDDSLMLKYHSEQPIPPDVIPRFIVRMNRDIKKVSRKNCVLVWRYGVILEIGNKAIALVQKDGQNISVQVKGIEKKEYLTEIRDTLNDIYDSYKTKKPELRYRVTRYGEILEEIEEQHPVWVSERKIAGYSKKNRMYYDEITDQDIDLRKEKDKYNIPEGIINYGTMNIGNRDVRIEENNFNFTDCNFNVQGSLNELAYSLQSINKREEANELKDAADALQKIENIQDKTEVKRSGLTNKLRRVVEAFEDKKSTLSKTVQGVKNGISIAQDIAEGYNKIAQWCALPQVPTPFLKKK